MKPMVRLIVLFATLLLLTGVSFANGDCYYYEYVYTNLDREETDTWCAELCFNSGTYSEFCESGNMILFFDSMKKQALLYSTNTTPPYQEVGYLKFHGDQLHVFTGIFYCTGAFQERFFVRGHKVDYCENQY